MKKLNNNQINNLKAFWEKEYLPTLKDNYGPARVFFNGKTLEWLTWEYLPYFNEITELENPEEYFCFDAGDGFMTFNELCKFAETYINTGSVATFYY